MKSIYIAMAILASVAMVTMGTQQVYVPRDCSLCGAIKKLTTEFEKDVLDAAIVDPGIIPGLLEQYNRDVLELFPSTSLS